MSTNGTKKTAKVKITENIIKQNAILLFLSKGYYQSSMNNIATACQVKKSSLYHHIENREALLFSIFEDIKREFRQKLENKTNKTSSIHHFIQISKHFFKKDNHGYLLLKLCSEIGDNVPNFKDHASQFYRDWTKQCTKLLKENGHKSAKDTAEQLLININGALLIDAIHNNNRAINRIWRELNFDVK